MGELRSRKSKSERKGGPNGDGDLSPADQACVPEAGSSYSSVDLAIASLVENVVSQKVRATTLKNSWSLGSLEEGTNAHLDCNQC